MKFQSVPILVSSLIGLTSAALVPEDKNLHKMFYDLPCVPCKSDNEKIIKDVEDICRPIKCKGVMPACTKVTSRSFISTGDATKAFRKASKKCESIALKLNEAVLLCTKQSNCKTISFERFLHAIHETVKILSVNKSVCFGPAHKKIIQHIYNAGIKSEATCEQLIIFTATAMHNCYLFNWFPESGLNTSVGSISRGLMQWLSREGYSNLTKVSTVNYLAQPYAVEYYNSESILNEFSAYLKFYNNDCLTGVNSFIFTIKAFNSIESPLVNELVAFNILKGIYVPCNHLEEKILRRFNIYYTLTSRIFNPKRTLQAEN